MKPEACQPISPAQHRRLGQLAAAFAVTGIATLLALILLAGCAGKNVDGTPKPPYPLHMLARDVSVGAEAFLRTAVTQHGAECNALCDPAKAPLIKNAGQCVTICNSLKLAASLHAALNTAIRVSCGGDAFLLEKAPCALATEPAAAAANEAALRKALADFEAAEADLKKVTGGQ